MKKKAIAVLAMIMVSGSSMTVCAAPKTMPDGTVFDADYYAETYPDVAAALGTDENALYHHYVAYGRAEGRIPCADGSALGQATIKEQVAALGITYDPSKDESIFDETIRYCPVGDNWHEWGNLWNDQTQSYVCHYTRADYTNDPLYLAFATELVKVRNARLAEINALKEAGVYYDGIPLEGDSNNLYEVKVYDEINGISFRDADREYLLNMLSNLMVDYIESLMGTDMTWCQQFGYVSDCTGINVYGKNRFVWLLPNVAGAGYHDR